MDVSCPQREWFKLVLLADMRMRQIVLILITVIVIVIVIIILPEMTTARTKNTTWPARNTDSYK